MEGRRARFSKSLYRTRFWAYAASTVFALVSTPFVGLQPLLVAVTVVGMSIAWLSRNRELPALAFAVDLVVAIALAAGGRYFVAFVIVVGWTGVIGMVTAGGHWGYATVGGLASVVVVGIHGFAEGLFLSADAILAGGLTILFGVVANAIARMVTAREAELEALFQRIPAAMFRMTTDGALVEGNPALGRLLGTGDAPVRLLSHEVDTLHVDPNRRVEFRATLERAGSVRDFEMNLVTRDGRRIVVLNNADVIRGADGSVEFIEGALFDITALREAQESRERLAKIVEATSDLVVIAESDGSITYANAAARAWVHTHVGSDDLTHVSQVASDEDLAKMMGGLELDRIWTGELELELKDRVLYMSVVAHRFDADDGSYFAVVGHDLTTERETANRLTELVRSKDEFVAAVSHELRTPLAAVVGMAAELRDRGGEFDADLTAELIGHVAEQSQEVADIVEDLLVAARADTDSVVLVPDWIDIGEAVKATERALPGPRPAGWLEVDAGARCFADPRRVRQILRNLLTNAMRYGGQHVAVTADVQNGFVSIRVADDGHGVPEDRVERIFEPFERAHVAGTQPASVGLGLTVSRWLARKMGGDLTYGRADDRSVFTLTLPAGERELRSTA